MEQPISLEQAEREIPGLEELLSTRPTVETVANLAARYFTLGDVHKAEPLSKAAFEHQPANRIVGVNYAMVLKDLGKHEESAKVIQQVYANHSEDSFTSMAYAESLLKSGFWSKAWPIYDNMRPTQQGAAEHLGIPLAVKEWQNQVIKPGEKLFVVNEGGIGDRISYARWLPELTKLGIDWYFYPYDELYSFFERCLPKERLIKDCTDINMQYWTTTFALPARLNATPNSVPHPLSLTANEDIVGKLRFEKGKVPVYGICWQAAELFQGGRRVRSMSEGQMMRLVTSTAYRVCWVNLQYGTKAPYPVVNLPFKTWEETAAIIDQLDRVVTVDTGVMHLAGSMRKPMDVLLSGNSCWKFLKTGAKCVWYPEAKLYRNEGYGFDNAIDKLVADIRK